MHRTLPLLLALVACNPLPETVEELDGYWLGESTEAALPWLAIGVGFSSTDSGAAGTPYERWTGPVAGPLSLDHAGRVSLDERGLSFTVELGNDALAPGSSELWQVDRLTDERLTLVDPSGVEHDYARVSALPGGGGAGSFGGFRHGALVSNGYPYRLEHADDGTLAFHTNGLGEGPQLHVWAADGTPVVKLADTPRLHAWAGPDRLYANSGALLVERVGSTSWGIELPGLTAHDLVVDGDEALVHASTFGEVPESLGLGELPAQTNHVVLRVALTDGAIVSSTWVGGGFSGPDLNQLVALSDGAFAVATPVTGAVETPVGTLGFSDTRGLVIGVFEPDGSPRWQRMLGPDTTFFPRTLLERPDSQLVVVGGARGQLNVGRGLVDLDAVLVSGSDQLVNLGVALDLGDGALRWDRIALDDVDDYGLVAAASRPDGVLAWVQSVTGAAELGGSVGTVSVPTGDGLVVALLDACGEAQHVAVFNECDCTYEDEPGFVQPWEAAFSPSGELVLGVSMLGYYRFDGSDPGGEGTTATDIGSVGVGYSAVVVLDGPAGVVGARVCPVPQLPAPSLDLSLSGAGSVGAEHLGSCDADCVLEGDLLERVVLTATPDEGMRFEGWGGLCEGVGDCVVALDDSVQAVSARFVPTSVGPVWPLIGTANLAVVSPVLATSPSGDSLLGARIQGDLSIDGTAIVSDTPGLPGVVVALSPTGAVRWSALLDPPGQGGTSVLSLLGQADGGAWVLTSGGDFLDLGSDGLLRGGGELVMSDAQLAAQDDAGSRVVVGGSGTQLRFDGVGGSAETLWTVALQSAGSVEVSDLVGLPTGFAARVLWSGVLTIDGTVIPETNGTLLLHLGSDGSVLSHAVLATDVPSGVYQQAKGILQRGPDDGLWLIGDRTRDSAAPVVAVYAEPIDDAGALRGGALASLLPDNGNRIGAPPLIGLVDGWGVVGGNRGPSVVDGISLSFRGDSDLVIGVQEGGSVVSAESLGSVSVDNWFAAGGSHDALLALGYLAEDGDAGGVAVPKGLVLVRAVP